jgi:hypothetical protein
MTKTIIVLFLAITLSGCFVLHDVPKENMEFAQKATPRDFKGVYRNAGDPKGYLSQLIWRKYDYITDNSGKKTPHKEIELIEVLCTGEVLTVRAIRDECAIYQQDYVAGQDFTLIDGKIVIKERFHPLSREGDDGGRGDVLVGPSYEKIELGLDAKGDGKYRSQGYFAGMVFLLVPMAVWDTSDVKFIKLNSNVTYELCTDRQKPHEAD